MNYTPEMTTEMVEAYKAQPNQETVNALATKFSKTVRSVIAKLNCEGVYHKKEYVTKTGTKPVAKETLVAEIADLLHQNVEIVESLEKANKKVLELLVTALNETKA